MSSEAQAGPSNMSIPKAIKSKERKSVSKTSKEKEAKKSKTRKLKEEKQPIVEEDLNEGFPGLKIKLFPHQLQSVKDMEKREDVRSVCMNFSTVPDGYLSPFGSKPVSFIFESNVGVLSDIPGYGKSLSMVGLLARDHMEWDMSTSFMYKKSFDNATLGGLNHCRYSTTHVYYEMPRINSTLLVCSPSVLSQWEEYFSFSRLKVISVTTGKISEEVNPNDWDVVMVVPSMYKKIHARFGKYAWKRFIYDDPTQCHVPSMNPVIAGFTWFISATNLYSFIGSMSYNSWIYKMFTTYTRWQYMAICVKNDDAFVRSSFKLPDPVIHRHKCFAPPSVNAVEEFVSGEVAEMLAAGDISGAIEKIGGQNTNGNLMEAVLKKHTDEKKDLVKSYDEAREVPSTDNHYRYYKKRAEELEARIKEIDRKIDCMKERFKDVLKEPCSICTDDLTKPILMPCCQHIFCGGCALGWLQAHRTCPMCRAGVAVSKLVYVSDNDGCFEVNKKPDEPKNEKPTKQEMLKRLLNDITRDSESRVILFSCYDKTFDMAKSIVDSERIDYAEIKGAAGTRKRKIEKYKKGDVNLLFLNANYNGAGINLQNTTHMIIYHEIANPETFSQIIGRAMRIGRKGPLIVHILE